MKVTAMRPSIGLILLSLSLGNVRAQQIDPAISAIINQANLDSLTFSVRELSGEVGTMINGLQDTLASRHVGSRGHQAAAQYLAQRLSGYGLPVFVQAYSSSGTNVYAVQAGADFPDIAYIVSAHYDDNPPTGPAPGADDNASGTAAVLEAARILSRYRTGYTVVYALWDEEESGLVGSTFYAQQAFNKGASILGVVNLDMLGWDSNNDGLTEVHTRSTARSIELADTVLLVNQLYGIGLKPTLRNPGTTASDHSSFWQKGYSAVLLIEAYLGGDFNSHYHSSTDRLQFFNPTFYHRASKLALGTMAFLAGIKGTLFAENPPAKPPVFALSQNFPNPFNPSTTVEFSLPRAAAVTVDVFNVLGEKVATLVAGQFPAGRHRTVWNASGSASGMYIYRMVTADYTETRRMMLVK
jgi:hypothetical protein